MSSKEEIKELTNSIIESRQGTKQIPDLISALDNPALVKISLNGLVKVFANLCKKGDLREAQDTDDPAVQKYTQWLNQVFESSLAKIASFLDSESSQLIKELCLTSFMKLLVSTHCKDLETWSTLHIKRLKMVIESLLSVKYDNQAIINRFQEYLEYPDAKFYTLQILSRFNFKKSNKHLIFRQNVLKFLEILNFDSSESPEGTGNGLLIDNYKLPQESYIKNFNTLWSEFRQIQHSEVDIYKRLLILLTDKVMPMLKNPLAFTDFLLESYNVGGSISLLALNGVFLLMTEHNLEYPDFYTKLYALCTPDLLHAKYRARFFHLANLFLSSSHLPEYLVAAFIKRLARCCLTAPANAILLILPFIGNLLIRHKGLLAMIDNPTEYYVMDEPDPKLCKAVESGLWEIKSLQNHALPQVAQAAKFINKTLPQMEWNVDDYLEITGQDMFATEAKKKIFVNVPLTFERPKTWSLAKDDILCQHFSI